MTPCCIGTAVCATSSTEWCNKPQPHDVDVASFPKDRDLYPHNWYHAWYDVVTDRLLVYSGREKIPEMPVRWEKRLHIRNRGPKQKHKGEVFVGFVKNRDIRFSPKEFQDYLCIPQFSITPPWEAYDYLRLHPNLNTLLCNIARHAWISLRKGRTDW